LVRWLREFRIVVAARVIRGSSLSQNWEGRK
jgi:hypothetical protein